jgi:periplasmic protein TonB
MKNSILISLLILTFAINAQTSTPAEPKIETENTVQIPENKPDKNGIYTVVEKMPEYSGGEAAMFAFLDKSQRVRPAANGCGIIGTVNLRFVVTKTGAIMNIEVLKTTHKKFNNEAIRLIKLIPAFIPGEEKGVKVDVYYTLPISIRLQ